MRVAEIFGPTFQGEGPSQGQRAVFLRLSGCNLTCTWCDTPYTWDWDNYDREAEQSVRPPEVVATQIHGLAPDRPLLVVTGGEPLLQQKKIALMLGFLEVLGDRRVEIETNGTRIVDGDLLRFFPRFNVSPKLANSGVDYDKRIRPAALDALRTLDSIFKFVVQDEACVKEIDDLMTDIHPSRVWLMPETTFDTDDRGLAAAALERGYNFTLRQHVTLWDGDRGH